MNNFQTNLLENNNNIIHPFDNLEKSINIIADNKNHPKKSLLILYKLLEHTRQKVYQNHGLKQGIIYQLIAEHFIKKNHFQFAHYNLEIANELLKNYKMRNWRVNEKLHNIEH